MPMRINVNLISRASCCSRPSNDDGLEQLSPFDSLLPTVILRVPVSEVRSATMTAMVTSQLPSTSNHHRPP